MKNLIFLLSLFTHTLVFSQANVEDFKGVWKSDSNEDNILIIYHNPEDNNTKFWNYSLSKDFNIIEVVLENGITEKEIWTFYADKLNKKENYNEYRLSNGTLVRNSEFQSYETFTKLN
tara:strand:+ start:1228 stop:1581 length:354 start_codon:yes stop_codon:yes gene_type:complete